eukprot:CAMPEP_0197834178 /NCGR_PEP_ID=MMETSP1437-20131217/21427_1 /TAXON_ID=49252 ORGANISM="Eucampia antarctica, Strain CCMP1452" /NCGR_SAMPLE_ID=MMETSP1437 /ASSEMBLY_ACC=CAM_ASM_001096 /LENGTH=524 /DNA_ID=CAMNT_0043438673 /DNA_START=74 /DNA_END=1646 /DNA_ORIENTATION=-
MGSGVNLGGWLVLERFITPYFFALTTCHLEGDYRFYEGQIDAPPVDSSDYKKMNSKECQPVLPYPVDEWTLTSAFANKEVAKRWLEFHWDNFVKRKDISDLKASGVTHIRVPLGHWIMGDIRDDEPWINGGWEYFVRLVEWCREDGIQVWPDIHTAPGSQNGFDNSGQLLPSPTCQNWSGSTENVERSLKVVRDVTQAVKDNGMEDVVTGFGILNEPFVDCDVKVVKDFDNKALLIVRENLGEDAAVYIGDVFNSTLWNDGWWTDETDHANTFLDSHYYHVFAGRPRHLSPKQHIALVCQHNYHDTVACCYSDHDSDASEGAIRKKTNTKPSHGISRMIGEWSASFDTLVSDKLDQVMAGVANNNVAIDFDREIGAKRQQFLSNFVKSQMVTYEAAHVGVSRAWFYWTMKMEGGAFAEWDFLRGIREGWIPKIPAPNVASTDLYGSCYDILSQTEDDMDIVHEFPAPTADNNNWQGIEITDDVVVSHGSSLMQNDKGYWVDPRMPNDPRTPNGQTAGENSGFIW